MPCRVGVRCSLEGQRQQLGTSFSHCLLDSAFFPTNWGLGSASLSAQGFPPCPRKLIWSVQQGEVIWNPVPKSGLPFQEVVVVLAEPHGVQGKFLPVGAGTPWRALGRQLVTLFKYLKGQEKRGGLLHATFESRARTNRETLKMARFWYNKEHSGSQWCFNGRSCLNKCELFGTGGTEAEREICSVDKF